MGSSVSPRGANESQSFTEVVRNFDESLMKAGKGPLRSDDFKSGTVYQNYYIARNKNDQSLKIIGLGERLIIAIKSMIWDDVPEEVIDCRNDEVVQGNADANKPDKNTLLRTIDNVFSEKTKGKVILRVAPWNDGDRKERAAASPPPPAAAAYSPKASINATMASAGTVVPASDIPPPPPPIQEIPKELFEEFTRLQTQVASLQAQLANAPKAEGPPAQPAAAPVPDPDLARLQAENERLGSELAALQKADEGLKGSLEQVSGERSALVIQLEKARVEIESLNTTVKGKEIGIVAYRNDQRQKFNEKEAEIKQLQANADEQRAKIRDLQAELDATKTSLNNGAGP
jgi:hypothetical protein